ncbi:hypothetical protein L486_01646 [Kwoniella mangroviensis CBS 10435]|uniref:Cytochrome P450 n=1 Tax=Kwoniella mangroviensis CBS 10435 TaxID=1331196 RepID=A0A1B9J2I1_9TREE|nr:hypothetical protein L486_01646 [Kwoniella mangroviensis CBS 10435]
MSSLTGSFATLQTHQNWLTVIAGVCLAVILRLVIRYLIILNHVKALPNIATLFFGFEPGTRTRLPHIPWICPVNDYTVYHPWLKYQRARSDLIAFPSLLSSTPAYVTSSPSTAQYISSRPHLFHKSLHMQRYIGFNVFGKTLLSTQTGDEHKRHWSVVRRCFSDRQMASVWEAMRWSLNTFISKEVDQGEEGVVEDVRESLIRVMLLVIGRKGFGKDFPWKIDLSSHTKVRLTVATVPFEESLYVVEQSVLLQMILPAVRSHPWAARKAFLAHLERMYLDKRTELQTSGVDSSIEEEKAPLLGALVHSQLGVEQEARLQGGDEKVAGLTKSEIIGNMCEYIAGHETSGHTLGFAVAYLALYHQWQEEVYQEIISACGDEQPTYKDMHKLPLTLAVCLESLRLRDIVSTIMKEAIDDVFVPYTTWDGEGNMTTRTHLVKKGSLFIIDSSATSIDPHAWGSDNMEFNPRRHLGDTPPFVSFSLGARQCLGKRFAEVEMTSFVSGLCRNFKVYPVKSHEEESWEEMKGRMIDSATEQISFQPGKFAVRLERR